jgi:hypothetical protein
MRAEANLELADNRAMLVKAAGLREQSAEYQEQMRRLSSQLDFQGTMWNRKRPGRR